MSIGDMSISAFSRRSLLSVKALRLYDDMGLLRPERIDPHSRYRYYSESQLEPARLISLLRKLDVPLAEITEIIKQNPADASHALTAWWQGEIARMDVRGDLLQYIRGSILVNGSESDVPADVCIPIAAGSIAEGDDLIRTESAHLQAYIVLRKYQLAFPQILPGLDAWRDVRSGERDSSKFLFHPDISLENLRDIPYLWHNTVLDLAALNRHEMVLWDVWGIDLAEVNPEGAALLDEVAATQTLEERQRLFARDEFRVPETILSFQPFEGAPVEVNIRQA